MRYPLGVVVLLCAVVLGGCASNSKQRAQGSLPEEVAQPRLREVLAYLAEHGFEQAKHAAVFDFTAWPMYEEYNWEDYPRKPRFEAASFVYDGKQIDLSVSPVKAFHSDGKVFQKVVLTYPKDIKEPNGAGVVLEGRTWTVAYKLEEPNAKLQERLTELVRDFLRQYVLRPAEESAR